MQSKFTGPLFIVGMPRSGTKLLRGILNEHALISVPLNETNFFPWLHLNWDKPEELSNYENFKKFYSTIVQFPYFIYRSKTYGNISCKTWFEGCEDYSVGKIFETLIRHDANAPFGSDIIWGDKSPSYINHIKLLYSNYPNAKLIHIVRDVRDYCLSINKAWNKNIFRAAQRWNDDVMQILKDTKITPKNSYIQVKYEDLLDNAENEVLKILNFLNLRFEKNILSLSIPTENIGAAKNKNYLVKNNKEKYKKYMSIKTQKKIESIAYSALTECNYEIHYSKSSERVTKLKMIYFKFLDVIYLIKFRIKEEGLKGCFKYNIHRLKL